MDPSSEICKSLISSTIDQWGEVKKLHIRQRTKWKDEVRKILILAVDYNGHVITPFQKAMLDALEKEGCKIFI